MAENLRRFHWAINLMNVQPSDVILEIGCGVGKAAELIAPRLAKGKLVAIDKSKPAVDKALKRNEAYVSSSNVKFIVSDLSRFSDDLTFNKIFCFNVNLFWTKRSVQKEMNIIRTHLAAAGKFYLFYGPLFSSNKQKVTDTTKMNICNEGFQILDFVMDKQSNCCCFICIT